MQALIRDNVDGLQQPEKKRIGDEDTNKAIGEHFCLPGHSLDNLKVTVLEKVKYYNEANRNDREHNFIRTFNTFYEGINKQK